MLLLGICAIGLPLQTDWACLLGLIVVGLGCAPIYPWIIHSTPGSFGAENSQAIIGVQMASAYFGSTFAPPIFGWIASTAGIAWYPAYLLAFAILMLIMTQRLNRAISKRAVETP